MLPYASQIIWPLKPEKESLQLIPAFRVKYVRHMLAMKGVSFLKFRTFGTFGAFPWAGVL